jgi:hypothetical protein
MFLSKHPPKFVSIAVPLVLPCMKGTARFMLCLRHEASLFKLAGSGNRSGFYFIRQAKSKRFSLAIIF